MQKIRCEIHAELPFIFILLIFVLLLSYTSRKPNISTQQSSDSFPLVEWVKVGNIDPPRLVEYSASVDLANNQKHILWNEYHNLRATNVNKNLEEWAQGKLEYARVWGEYIFTDASIIRPYNYKEKKFLSLSSLFDINEKEIKNVDFLPLNDKWAVVQIDTEHNGDEKTYWKLIDSNLKVYSFDNNFATSCSYCRLFLVKQINDDEFLMQHGYGDGCGGAKSYYRLNTASKTARFILSSAVGCGYDAKLGVPSTVVGNMNDGILMSEYNYSEPGALDNEGYTYYLSLSACGYDGLCRLLISRDRMPIKTSSVIYVEKEEKLYLKTDSGLNYRFDFSTNTLDRYLGTVPKVSRIDLFTNTNLNFLKRHINFVEKVGDTNKLKNVTVDGGMIYMDYKSQKIDLLYSNALQNFVLSQYNMSDSDSIMLYIYNPYEQKMNNYVSSVIFHLDAQKVDSHFNKSPIANILVKYDLTNGDVYFEQNAEQTK